MPKPRTSGRAHPSILAALAVALGTSLSGCGSEAGEDSADSTDAAATPDADGGTSPDDGTAQEHASDARSPDGNTFEDAIAPADDGTPAPDVASDAESGLRDAANPPMDGSSKDASSPPTDGPTLSSLSIDDVT